MVGCADAFRAGGKQRHVSYVDQLTVVHTASLPDDTDNRASAQLIGVLTWPSASWLRLLMGRPAETSTAMSLSLASRVGGVRDLP